MAATNNIGPGAQNGMSLSPRSQNNANNVVNVGRKYRGSSRQSSQEGRRAGNRRHQKYGENYDGNGNNGLLNNTMMGQQQMYGQMGANGLKGSGMTGQTDLLPQIGGPPNSALKRNVLPPSQSMGYQAYGAGHSHNPYGGGGGGQLNPMPAMNAGNPHALLGVASNPIAGNRESPVNSVSVPSNSNNFTVVEEHNFSAVTSIRGMKPGNPNWINQDNFFIIEAFDNKDIRLYCVLDGHGENGHLVSRRIKENFPGYIKSTHMDMEAAFNMMQNDLASCDLDVRCSGATCVMASVMGGKLTIYNCGDSRAVLGRRNQTGSIVAHAVSNDHKPDKPEERKRILACGGHLGCRSVLVNQGGRGPVSMPVGPCRVWYQHRGETLGLAMSRSLGDVIVHKSGVSAEPEILEHVIDDQDQFVIMATDGVWDVVDNTHAVQMVHNFAMRSPNWNPSDAANCICKFARSRWEKLSPMIDDITCIVLKLHSTTR